MSDEPDAVPSEPTAAVIPAVRPYSPDALRAFTNVMTALLAERADAREWVAHELASAVVVRDMADARYRHWRAIETAALRLAEPKYSEVRLKEAIDARPEFLAWKQARADAAAWVTFYGAMLGQQPAVPE